MFSWSFIFHFSEVVDCFHLLQKNQESDIQHVYIPSKLLKKALDKQGKQTHSQGEDKQMVQ